MTGPDPASVLSKNLVDIANENSIQVNFEQSGKHIMCQGAGVARYHVLHQVSQLQIVSIWETANFEFKSNY